MTVDLTPTIDVACKTVRQLGLSKKRTHQILNGLKFSLENNGPEWTIGRLKELAEYALFPEDNPFPAWIAYKSDGTSRKPKGWMAYCFMKKPKTTNAVLRSLVNACTLDHLTDKQLDKWSQAVTNPPRSSRLRLDKEVKHLPQFNRKTRAILDAGIQSRFQQRSFFGPEDIHGTRIPTNSGCAKVRLRDGYPLGHDQFRACVLSLESAPVAAYYYFDSLKDPCGLSADLKSRIVRVGKHRCADSTHRWKYDPKKGRLVKKSGRAPKPVEVPVGEISFLQKPGGKARCVANPNRFVQWLSEPFGEALSDLVNRQPGVYVTDQVAGQLRIQEWLRQGISLTSMDLSSASDTLDFSIVVDALRSSSDDPDFRAVWLDGALDFFTRVSRSSWRVSDPYASEYLGDNKVRFAQGQPLGLRPSFPMLTLCNLVAAEIAVVRTNNDPSYVKRDILWDPQWVIVGDDIVMPTKYAKAYQEAITEMGGMINLEKSMTSKHRAEFCSRIITRDQIFRLKPRYLEDNDPQNLLTYQYTGLKPKIPTWLRKMLRRQGSFALVESGAIPPYAPDKPRPLSTKLLTAAILSLEGKGLPESEASLESLYLRYKEDQDPLSIDKPKRKQRHPMKGFDKMTSEEKVRLFMERNPNKDILEIHRIYCERFGDPNADHFLERLAKDDQVRLLFPDIDYPYLVETVEHEDLVFDSSATMQKVMPVRTFDHHTHDYTRKVDPITSVKRIDRKLDQIERDLDELYGAVITPIGPGVERLVELTDEGVEVSYHSTSKQKIVDTPGVKVDFSRVPKTVSDVPPLPPLSERLKWNEIDDDPDSPDDDYSLDF